VKLVGPHLRSRLIGEIETPELLAVLKRLEKKGILDTAHRVRAVCVRVFRYAIATGRATRDISADLKGALSAAAPVQIRVYEDRLHIWNPAVLPDGWAVEDLLREHASFPYNPNIANAFFRAGEIEAWGRGIQRIFQACREANTPEP
jgi:hypothetical protein